MRLTSMKVLSIVALVALLLTLRINDTIAAPTPSAAAPPPPLEVFPNMVTLESSRDIQSLVVRFNDKQGISTDVTNESEFALGDPSLAKVESGIVKPITDGATRLKIKYKTFSVEIPVTVKEAKIDRPISFKLDVMPVFMNSGCNTGACHGAARGKDGFRISLFGFDPDGDYNRITREMTTRRINLALPEESLLLQKGTGAVAHTGGTRFKPDSENYKTLMRWLEAGAPSDPDTVAKPISAGGPRQIFGWHRSRRDQPLHLPDQQRQFGHRHAGRPDRGREARRGVCDGAIRDIHRRLAGDRHS